MADPDSSKATARPWQRSGVRSTIGANYRDIQFHFVGPYDGGWIAAVPYSDLTAEEHCRSLADADLIVTAVNNYDSLRAQVATLRSALQDMVTEVESEGHVPHDWSVNVVLRRARAALQQSEPS